jgi:hypothetical protein
MSKECHVLKHEIFDELKEKKHGIYSGYAFLSFRQDYYDKIQDPQEKALVQDILLNFLKIDNFSYSYDVAWICADLEIPGYENAIKKMVEDGKARVTLDVRVFKSLFEQFEVDRALTEELEQMKLESNEKISIDIFNRGVAFYKKLRGDVSKMYISKDTAEKLEPNFLKQYVCDRFLEIMRSEYRDSSIKTKATIITSDLRYRTAIPEIEKLLQDKKVTDTSHLNLIKQSLARLKEQL